MAVETGRDLGLVAFRECLFEHLVPWKGGMASGAAAVAAGVCVWHPAIADEKQRET